MRTLADHWCLPAAAPRLAQTLWPEKIPNIYIVGSTTDLWLWQRCCQLRTVQTSMRVSSQMNVWRLFVSTVWTRVLWRTFFHLERSWHSCWASAKSTSKLNTEFDSSHENADCYSTLQQKNSELQEAEGMFENNLYAHYEVHVVYMLAKIHEEFGRNSIKWMMWTCSGVEYEMSSLYPVFHYIFKILFGKRKDTQWFGGGC